VCKKNWLGYSIVFVTHICHLDKRLFSWFQDAGAYFSDASLPSFFDQALLYLFEELDVALERILLLLLLLLQSKKKKKKKKKKKTWAIPDPM